MATHIEYRYVAATACGGQEGSIRGWRRGIERSAACFAGGQASPGGSGRYCSLGTDLSNGDHGAGASLYVNSGGGEVALSEISSGGLSMVGDAKCTKALYSQFNGGCLVVTWLDATCWECTCVLLARRLQ